jgi:starvation-inducible DNA-binding protein
LHFDLHMKNQISSNAEKNKRVRQNGNGSFQAQQQEMKNFTTDKVIPSIGIEPKKLERITEILNQTLANQHVLYVKTRNFHWNLIGRRFHPLHLFLEEQYKELENVIDETAERTRMVGGVPLASMGEFLQTASLEEQAGNLIDGDQVIQALLQDHEKLIVETRKNIDLLQEKLGDAGTADFLTDLIKLHEKTAWMLRSHLE